MYYNDDQRDKLANLASHIEVLHSLAVTANDKIRSVLDSIIQEKIEELTVLTSSPLPARVTSPTFITTITQPEPAPTNANEMLAEGYQTGNTSKTESQENDSNVTGVTMLFVCGK